MKLLLTLFLLVVSSQQVVVSDQGTLQKLLGRLLEGERAGFFVNARRNDSAGRNLYQYSAEGEEEPPLELSHLASSQEGECLTFTSWQGRLVSRGIQCKRKRKPLCHRLGPRFSVARMERHVSTCSSGGRNRLSYHWNLQLI